MLFLATISLLNPVSPMLVCVQSRRELTTTEAGQSLKRENRNDLNEFMKELTSHQIML